MFRLIISNLRTPENSHFSILAIAGSVLGARISFNTQLVISNSMKELAAINKLTLKDELYLNMSKSVLTTTMEVTPNVLGNYYSNKWGW